MVYLTSFLIPLFPIAFFFIFLKKWQHGNNNAAGKRLPPSPRKLPVIGNLHQLGPLPHRSLHTLSTKHGPLMLLHFGRVPVLVVSSAQVAREITKNQDVIFSNRPRLTAPEKLFYGYKDVVFSPYGEYWRKMRGICVNQLLTVNKVQSFRRVREEETSLMIDNISKLVSSNDDSVVNLSDMLALLTNDVLCRVAFGTKYSDREQGKKFKMMLSESVDLLGTFYVGDYIPWLSWIDRVSGVVAKADDLANRFDHFLEIILEEHKSKIHVNGGESSKDLVDTLLEIQKQNKDGSTIGNDAIKAIIVNIFSDGTDTTYSALEWIMAELVRNPKIMEKLQEEVRSQVVAGTEITEDNLEKIPYLRAVIKESLRLHPPVPLLVPRETTRDTTVMGYDIAAKTQVYTSAWSIGRDPLFWKDPEDFNPDRFLDTDIDVKGQHFELIPFGAGRRGCPGITYSAALNELTIAKLVDKFNFDLPNGAKKSDLDVSESTGVTSHLKFPLLVVATPYH